MSSFFTRRQFVQNTGAGMLGIALSNSLIDDKQEKGRELLLYVGTYTSGKSEGIYVYKFNLASGELTRHGVTKDVVNPSYLVIDARRKFLYAVNETTESGGKKSGAISAFAIDQKSGELKFINQQLSMGGAPCHLITTRDGKFVLTANYVGGNVAVLPVRADGGLGEAVEMKQHQGTGPNQRRQEAAHAHNIILDHSERFAFVCDLGIDKVMIYRFDKVSGKLTPNAQPFASLKPGAGPRHLTFHPHGRYAYVINELNSTITAFSYNKGQGTLSELQSVPTLPADFSGENSCADIHVHPSGGRLYGSNRGHDSIVVYAIDERTGKLNYLQHHPTGGHTPRNFAIDPTGKFLLMANQRTDNVTVAHIDALSGRLTPTGQSAEIPAPVCLKMIPMFSEK
jgi:6-phosphogluconolactonase